MIKMLKTNYHNSIKKVGVYDTKECLHFIETLTERDMAIYAVKYFFNNEERIGMNILYIDFYGKETKLGVQFFKNNKMIFAEHYRDLEKFKEKASELIYKNNLHREVKDCSLSLD